MAKYEEVNKKSNAFGFMSSFGWVVWPGKHAFLNENVDYKLFG